MGEWRRRPRRAVRHHRRPKQEKRRGPDTDAVVVVAHGARATILHPRLLLGLLVDVLDIVVLGGVADVDVPGVVAIRRRDGRNAHGTSGCLPVVVGRASIGEESGGGGIRLGDIGRGACCGVRALLLVQGLVVRRTATQLEAALILAGQRGGRV